MNTYHIFVTGPDAIGLNWISNIIEVANLGATLKPGTIPSMRFPHSVSMELVADEPPAIARPGIRVFREDGSEVKPGDVEPVNVPVVAAVFSTDEEEDEVEESTGSEETVEQPKSEVKVHTREELDAMSWDELKAVAKAVGVTGRDRDKVTKGYLDKVAVSE